MEDDLGSGSIWTPSAMTDDYAVLSEKVLGSAYRS
jgi:hypothetical protein